VADLSLDNAITEGSYLGEILCPAARRDAVELARRNCMYPKAGLVGIESAARHATPEATSAR
jgi:hypothetical protein